MVAGGFERSLWLVARDGSEERIPVEARGYRWPRVSPDGNRVAVIVDPCPSDLWMVDLQRGSAEPITTAGHHVNLAFAPDGERLGFSLQGDLHWIRWREGGEPQLASARPLPQYQPSWSIDDHIMVTEIHPENGSDLAVIKDGREIFYRSGTRILAVEVSTSPTFSSGPPRELFDARGYDFSQFINWDVGPDGRFVMVKSDPSRLRQLQIVQNWFEEL